MTITASMVKELRERSGAGMMDCKKALKEVNGDLEAAIEFLRKSGIAKAAKKAGRTVPRKDWFWRNKMRNMYAWLRSIVKQISWLTMKIFALSQIWSQRIF